MLIFTVARSKPEYGEMAMGLGRSLATIGGDTPRAVQTYIEGYDWLRYFDLAAKPPATRSAFDKLIALDLTDFDQIHSIYGDSLAFKRVSPILSACLGMPVAIQGAPVSAGDWHGSKPEEVLPKNGIEKFSKFNGGSFTTNEV